MSNPFPGMNPYLENDEWTNFHNSLVITINQKILPFIRPKYRSVVEKYVVQSDAAIMGVSVTYQPDVTVFKNEMREPTLAYEKRVQVTKADFSIPINEPIEVKIPFIEIRDRNENRLITIIEILSPANKTGRGFEQYQKKRWNLLQSPVHLLEKKHLNPLQRLLQRLLHIQNPMPIMLILSPSHYSLFRRFQ